jgi:hypothetical protein
MASSDAATWKRIRPRARETRSPSTACQHAWTAVGQGIAASGTDVSRELIISHARERAAAPRSLCRFRICLPLLIRDWLSGVDDGTSTATNCLVDSSNSPLITWLMLVLGGGCPRMVHARLEGGCPRMVCSREWAAAPRSLCRLRICPPLLIRDWLSGVDDGNEDDH